MDSRRGTGPFSCGTSSSLRRREAVVSISVLQQKEGTQEGLTVECSFELLGHDVYQVKAVTQLCRVNYVFVFFSLAKPDIRWGMGRLSVGKAAHYNREDVLLP